MISAAQAEFNHAAEVQDSTLETAAQEAKAAWSTLLSRVNVQDVGPGYTEQQDKDWLTGFYSSLYRAAKYPRMLFELDGAGNPIHWSPYTGAPEQGVFPTDQGFWDAYRSTYSLLALWVPERMAEMMEGWLNAWREGGWVPQWSAPAPKGSMTGTMSDVSMSEAIVKLPHCGTARGDASGYCVNATALYEASRQNAFVVPGEGVSEGRVCLEEYIQLGYIPQGCSDADVSRSMNYWHSDWALSQAAQMLGETDDAAQLLARSQKWKTLLDPSTGFFRVKDKDGNFS